MPDYLLCGIGYTTVCRCRSSPSSSSSYSVLRQGNSLSQSELFRKCGLVLPLSSYNNTSFPQGHTVAAYVFFLIFPSIFFLSSFQVCRYSSFWALESLKNASFIFCVKPFVALLRVPRICNTSLWKTSSDLILVYPLSVI